MLIHSIVIIGGGLAGLLTSIQLARQKIPCLVIEKRKYPFHRVCGEYISNETVPFLTSLDLYPQSLSPIQITEFQLSAVNGKTIQLPLDLGGFGISRFVFDEYLYQKAKALGVEFMLDTEVGDMTYTHQEDCFYITTPSAKLSSRLVVGAFGKRSKLDASLARNFFKRKSPYVGVKYHIHADHHPSNLIALHNFDGGYCGISHVEGGKANLCYLVHRDQVRKFKSITQLEQLILCKNPHLKKIFETSTFLFEKPETVNEISFETKEPVWNHLLMAGDAAGMITPLCGNGMAMAIHSSKILSSLILKHLNNKAFNRLLLEEEYKTIWNNTFAHRLWFGRIVQNKLFGSSWGSSMAINIAIGSKTIANQIIKNTHGKPF